MFDTHSGSHTNSSVHSLNQNLKCKSLNFRINQWLHHMFLAFDENPSLSTHAPQTFRYAGAIWLLYFGKKHSKDQCLRENKLDYIFKLHQSLHTQLKRPCGFHQGFNNHALVITLTKPKEIHISFQCGHIIIELVVQQNFEDINLPIR